LVHKTQDEDNPETLATFGTQETGRRQSRDTGNIWYTRHRTKKIQIHWQHRPQKTRDEEKEKKKGQAQIDNPDTLATPRTKDT
jgi:hypothetical protein